MKIKLEKPIVYFDLETSGVSTEESRIVEMACIKYNVDGTKEEKTIVVNPGVPIPIEASDVHGFTDEMVADKPTFKQYAQAVRDWFEGADLAGYNSDNFDVHLLSKEFERAGLKGIDWNPNLMDILKMYRLLFPNTLSDVYKRLTGKDLEGAHGALADVSASIEIGDILIPMLSEKSETPITTVKDIDVFMQGDKTRVDLMGKLWKDAEGVVRYNFGKDKDKSVIDNKGFGQWMLKQDFPQETKDRLKEII